MATQPDPQDTGKEPKDTPPPHQGEVPPAPVTPPKPAPDLPIIPNMSLDDDQDAPIELAAEPEIEVFEVEEAAEIPSGVPIPMAKPVPASEPPSEVFEAILVEDDEVLGEAHQRAPVAPAKKPDSDVFLADVDDEAVLAEAAPPSDVVEAESASEVMDIEEAVLADEVVPAQPMDSPVMKALPPITPVAAEAGSGLVAAEDEVLDAEEVETLGSSAVVVEPLTGDLVEASSSISEAKLVAPSSKQVPAAPASGASIRTDEAHMPPVPEQPAEPPIAEASAEIAETIAMTNEVPAAAEVHPHTDVFFEEATAEAAPESALEAEEEVVEEEEAAETAPASDIAADVLFQDAPIETAPASAVEDEEAAAVAPASDIAADVLFQDAPIEAVPASAVEEEEIAAAAPASDIVVDELFQEPVAEAAPGSAVEAEEAIEAEEIAEAAPASDIDLDALFQEPTAAAAPESAVEAEEAIEAEEIAEAAPASDIDLDGLFQEPVAEAAPESAVEAEEAIEAEEIAEAAPASDIDIDALFQEPTAEAAPDSAVEAEEAIEAEEIAEAAPAWDIAPAADVAEAAPASGVHEQDDVVFDDDIAEAAPSSAHEAEEVLAEDSTEPASALSAVEEAMPASDEVAEEVWDDDIAEAAPASDVVTAEEVTEQIASAPPASAVEEDVFLAEEEPEAVSSGTRKAESVFDEEILPPGSQASVPIPAPAASDIVVEAFDEATELHEAPLAEEPSAARPGARKKKASDPTLAFEPPPSSRAERVTDDISETSEGSAVQLGDMPKKGSSVSSIDPLAEELESGVGLDSPAKGDSAKEASVEFDEILDDVDDSNETDLSGVTKSAPRKQDSEGSTEMEVDAVLADSDEEPIAPAKGKGKDKAGKKGKKSSIAQTGDDVDLAEMFGEDEAEAVEADEDEAAEAADADENEAEPVEAADAFDEEMAAVAAEDEAEEAESLDDEDMGLLADEEEAPAPKGRKDKKGKPLAPPHQPQPSMALRWLGGMFVGTILLAGGGTAAWYFAPDDIASIAKMSPNRTPAPPPPKPPEKSAVEKARAAIDQGDFKTAIELLKNGAAPADLSTRGEARWLSYLKQQTEKKADLDPTDPLVKEARADLTKADNKLLMAQMDAALQGKELNDQLSNIKLAAEKAQKEIADLKGEKQKADTVLKEARQALVDGKAVEKLEDVDLAVLPKVLKDLGAKKTALDEVNRTLKAAEIKEEGSAGVKEVLKAKKESEDKVAAVNKVLEEEKIKGKDAEGVQEIAKARTEVTKDRDDLAGIIASAFKELVEGKIVPMNDDPRKEIVAGIKIARQKAESPLAIPLEQLGASLGGIGAGTGKVVQQTFDMARVFAELGYFEAREPFIQTPQQKMDTYIALLQDRRQNNAKELQAIEREADWILSDKSKADADARGKARYVQGLALRNQEKFAEARTAFDEALKRVEPPAKASPWSRGAEKAKEELTDPAAYYLPRLEKFQAEGKYKAALDEANVALKAMPDQGLLFAQRGLIRLELARSQGKVPEEAQKAIRADADAAGKDQKLADASAYIVGLLEQELGHMKKAEELYRQALKQATEQYPDQPDRLDRYRLALGKLLLLERSEAAPAVPEKNDQDKKAEKASFAPILPERTIVLHPWTPLVISAMIAAQPADQELEDAETLAKLKEAETLARELIASKNPKIKGQGHIMLGQAYSKRGQRTEGLKEIAKGLALLYPGAETGELVKMIDEHPALGQPDSSNIPNPVMAERYFGEGLHNYWSRQYPLAEAQFKEAIRYYNQDARFQYFLGLAQMAQGTRAKRDAAIYAFEQGARLEARNPSASREINMSLERIQGELRQQLNSYRYKAMTPTPEGNPP